MPDASRLVQWKTRANIWALRALGRDRIDYLASNTMTLVNRRLNDFLWTYDAKAVVTAVRDEAAGVKTFTLLPNQHWRGLRPGQYIDVTVGALDGEGRPLTRSYSPALTADGELAITVKRSGRGEVSGWMQDWLRPGSVVGISQAQGCFHYRDQPKLLMLCAGSGITPCHALIADLLARGVAVDLALHARFARRADVIFADTLRAWGARFPVEVALSRETVEGYATPLTADELVRRFTDFRQRDIYLCGPTGFMEQMVDILGGLDFDLGRLHTERFTPPDNSAVPDFQASAPEIRFAHLDRTVQLTAADAGLTLLEVAERHGVPVESGCRKGMCGSCKLTLKDGRVSGNTLGNAVYLCSAHPVSARVVLDA